MKVRFYKTNKRVNSTLIPTVYTEYDCQLKDDCAITAPVITLSVFTDYNYCYIPQFKRYYFVTGCIVGTHGIYTYTLAVDVLATYKSEILSQTTYVKRSASNYDLMLTDDTWLHDMTFTESVKTASNSELDTGSGTYLITIVNSESAHSANPASTMYAMADSGLNSFLAEMFDLEKYSAVTDLEATYFNPYQYVTSCKWFPLNVDTFAGVLKKVKYGWYEAEGSTYLVTQYGRTLTWTITIPSYSDWTGRDAGWTKHLLYVPFCGEVEIDPIYSGKTLTVKMYIDFNTGGCNCVITDGTNQIVSSISGQAGVEVSISQVAGEIKLPTSKTEALATGGKALAGAFTRDSGGFIEFGKNLLNALGQGTALSFGQGNIEDTISANKAVIDSGKDVSKSIVDGITQALLNPTVSKSGADGARYSILNRYTMILYSRKFNRYVDAHNYNGGMCHKILTLNTLSGYTQVANGMFNIQALDEEKSAIRQITENGFYIE